MAAILEMLRTRMTARKESNAETLVAAARRVAAGENVDPTAVESALVAEGKSVDDFESMCELARRRQTWHAARDKGPAAISDRDKLTAELESAHAAFEKVHAQWAEKSRRLSQQIDAAIAIVQAANDATDKLTAPANISGPLADRIRKADEDHAEALQTVDAIRRELREAKSRVKDESEWVSHKKQFNDQRLSTLDEHERSLKRAERRVAELEAALPPAEKAVAAALKTLNERRAAALKL
jgi:chromosome segregation ATPase